MNIEKVAQSELEWLSIMTSRQYQPKMVEFIIKDSGRKEIEYLGSYLLAPDKKFSNRFTNEEDINLDVLYLDGKAKAKIPRRYGDTQRIIESLNQLLTYRFPKYGDIGIYFIGELHDSEGSIHWNLMIVETEKYK